MQYEEILYEVTEGVAEIAMNRPQALNAMNNKMLDELIHALQEADSDDRVRAILLTGIGRGFCVGADLKETAERLSNPSPNYPAQENRNLHMEPLGRWARLERQLRQAHKPLVAAVNGLAVGGGLMLAAACDVRIAAKSAGFCAIFAKRGLAFEAGTSYYLPRLIGLEQTFRMIYSADMYTAEKAQAIGLVGDVFEDVDLMPKARDYVAAIAALPTLQLGIARRELLLSMRLNDPEAQMMVEMFGLGQAQQTLDYKEGHLSFAEKRDSDFVGY